MPAKFVLGRNDGIRVGQAIGAGGFDHDRVPCPTASCSGGTQLGTDIYISGATVTYQANRQILPDDPRTPPANLDRFGDFRFQPNASFPGTPTLNLSNGAVFNHITSLGGDSDGMWTRWNGAELNIDNATFHRAGDKPNGFSGGAMMLASYHGYANSVQTISLTNGGRFENEGQLWWGVSGFGLLEDNQPGIRVVMNINNGHLDLTGGDEYELDNDGLPLRADMAFIYGRTPDGDTDPTDNETYIINFTGPGTITVDGDSANSLDGDTSTGGGGIRVARQTGATVMVGTDTHAVYEGGDVQKSYQDLWNLGILRANNLSGLTGANFNDYFTVTNSPGQNDYKLTSIMASVPCNKCKGDFNNNGVVDAADYVVWRNTLGSTTDLSADADGSLNITAVDLMRWTANFGSTVPGVGAGAGVPEPATALLVMLGLGSFVAVRRRAS
jgi:hypothetical protein